MSSSAKSASTGTLALARRPSSVRRSAVGELPRVYEESSLECTFHTTFLLPADEVGEEFFETLRRSFVEAEGHKAAANAERGFVLVPYDEDRKTAIVTLRRVGPFEALEQLRHRSLGGDGPGKGLCRSEGLPETCDEMAALSTALIYVTHGQFGSGCIAEHQLGPVCAAETSYRSSSSHQPCRFVAALHDPPASGPGVGCDDISRELQARRVGPLPVLAVERRDLASHRRLLVHIVESLAQHFARAPLTGLREVRQAQDIVTAPLRRSGGGLLSTHSGCWGSCAKLPLAVVRY